MDEPDPAAPAQPREADELRKGGPLGGERATLRLPSLLHSIAIRIFVGPSGVRAGWRLLLFAVLAFSFSLILWGLAPLVIRPSQVFTPPALLLREGIVFAAVLAAASAMGRIERRSLSAYGLPARGAFGTQFWQGIGFGFAAITALLVVLWAMHDFSFESFALRGREAVYYAVLWAIAFQCVGFSEEFLTRGYALYTLSAGVGFWPAAVLLSALFAALHLGNAGENWTGILNAALIGLFFSLTVRRTGNLWFAIGMHAMWDYSETFLYSVPNSGLMATGHLLNSSFHGPRWLTGGSAGPEGSVLATLMILVLFVVFDRYYRDVRFPVVSKPQVTAAWGDGAPFRRDSDAAPQ